jgi:hypothetical protein
MWRIVTQQFKNTESRLNCNSLYSGINDIKRTDYPVGKVKCPNSANISNINGGKFHYTVFRRHWNNCTDCKDKICSDTCTDRKGEHVYEHLGTVTHGKVIENMTIVSLGKPDMTGQDKEQNVALASVFKQMGDNEVIINQKHTNLINADGADGAKIIHNAVKNIEKNNN